MNSLFPKTDEIRAIAKISNATVIGITKSKLDTSTNHSKISIEGTVQFDKIEKGRVEEKCFKSVCCFSNETENIFIKRLMLKSKPIAIGIICKPPDQLTHFSPMSHFCTPNNLWFSDVFRGHRNVTLG